MVGILLDVGNTKVNWTDPRAFKEMTDNDTNNYHTMRLVLSWEFALLPVKAL